MGDFCQLWTNQESRTCPEGPAEDGLTEWGYAVHADYVSIAKTHCDFVAVMGEAEATAMARRQMGPAGIRVVNIANQMSCRGLTHAGAATARSGGTTTTTTRRITTTMTAEVTAYLSDLWNLQARVQKFRDHLHEVNDAWDTRTQTLSETDVALESATQFADNIMARFEHLEAPPRARIVHGQIGTTLDRINNWTGRMLTGLRSSDTGEARAQALAAVTEAADALESEIGRVEDILGAPPSTTRPPTTTTRVRVTTTTATTLGDADYMFEALVAFYGFQLDASEELLDMVCSDLDAGVPLMMFSSRSRWS